MLLGVNIITDIHLLSNFELKSDERVSTSCLRFLPKERKIKIFYENIHSDFSSDFHCPIYSFNQIVKYMFYFTPN